MSSIKVVFVGASAGGVQALKTLFRQLDGRFHLPMVVVQHLPQDSTVDPGLVFSGRSKLIFIEAADKVVMQPGYVYFAPPGYHLLIESDHSFGLTQDDPVHFARPSIDVTFMSGAEVFGAGACGVVLTGANPDGADGLKRIGDAGGFTIVQDPEEAESSMMPLSAIEIAKPKFVGRLSAIAEKLITLQGRAG